MRTVDRATVPRPSSLDPAKTAPYVEEYRKCVGPSGVKKHVFNNSDVQQSLQRLYLKKCSLCEAMAEKDGVVEHFVPHHPQQADLAYLWENLHWTCGECNQRKRSKV